MLANWKLATLATIVLLALGATRWHRRPEGGDATPGLHNAGEYVAVNNDVPHSRMLAATSAKFKAKVLLSATLATSAPARRIIDALEDSGAVEVDVLFRPPLDFTSARDTAVLIVPALKADYFGKSSLAAFPNPQTAAREMMTALKQMLFYGGSLVLTAPTDPRDIQFIAMLLRALTGTPLVCSGEAVANQQLGTSYKMKYGRETGPDRLPDVEGQVQPLSCNFPESAVTHYKTADGYPTVVYWPMEYENFYPRGLIWVVGFTYENKSAAWDKFLSSLISEAGAFVNPDLEYPATRKPPSPAPPRAAVNRPPPPPAWLTWGLFSSQPPPSPPRQPPPPPYSPPPPKAGAEQNCTTGGLKHTDYGVPAEWFRSATPLVPCNHPVNKQLVVPQCINGAVVYWDAETGTQQLQAANFSSTCSSPCLTFQSDVYYRHGEVEKQLVYDIGSANCSGVNRTRSCSDGAFGGWSLIGSRYRDEPCDGTCLDEEYDLGAVFAPGQTQVRIFYSAEYVSYGASCASVAVARVRTCSTAATGAFSDWSTGPIYSECFVQCPPADQDTGERVGLYSPSNGVLGRGAIMNRTMYGSSVEDEEGRCLSKWLQRVCGRPTSTRIRHETPQQQLAETYGEVRLTWLPSSPWQLLDPEYPHTTCYKSCQAPDGRFVPHGTSYSFLMYAAAGSVDKLPVAPPRPPSPPKPPPPAAAAGRRRQLNEQAQSAFAVTGEEVLISEFVELTGPGGDALGQGHGRGVTTATTLRRRKVFQQLLVLAQEKKEGGVPAVMTRLREAIDLLGTTTGATHGEDNSQQQRRDELQALYDKMVLALSEVTTTRTDAAAAAAASTAQVAGDVTAAAAAKLSAEDAGTTVKAVAAAGGRRLLSHDYDSDYSGYNFDLSGISGDLLDAIGEAFDAVFGDYSMSDLFDYFESFSLDFQSVFWVNDYGSSSYSPPPAAGSSYDDTTGGIASRFYTTSCYNKSVNVYSSCRDGKLSSQWLDASGQVQTNLTALVAFCRQECGPDQDSLGVNLWNRDAYGDRQFYYYERRATSITDIYSCQRYASNASNAAPAVVTSNTSFGLGFAPTWSEDGSLTETSFAWSGRVCALGCAQSMLADGRPDPACNYGSCCYDGADYEVWMLSKLTAAQRLALLNTEDATQDAIRLLGDVCNLQQAYTNNAAFGDELQRLLVVAACRVQMALLGGSDVTGVQVPNVVLQTRSGFQASIEQMLGVLRLLEGAMVDASSTASQQLELLQQYYYRSSDNPTIWAKLQPTYHGAQLKNGETTLQSKLDMVVETAMQTELVGAVMQRELRDITLGMSTTDLQGDQAKLMLNRLLRSSIVQEALLTSPSGLLLLPDGKTMPDGRGSSSFSIVDEWTKGDLVLSYTLANTASAASLVTAPSVGTSSGTTTTTTTTYAHFISVGLGVDPATGGYVFQLVGVPVANRVVPVLPSRYELKESDGKNYTGQYMVHKPTGMVLIPSGDRVLIQGLTLEDIVMGKAVKGPSSFNSLTSTFKDVGASMTGGDAWDSDGDGLMSVEELWDFLVQLGLVQDMGISIWDAWRQAMFKGVWSVAGTNATWGGLLDGYTHTADVSYNAVDAVAALLRRAVGKTDGMTHSFWGFSLWDADHDGVISQADVLRTIGTMGYLLPDGVKLVTQFYSEYGAGSAHSNSTANSTTAAGGRRRRMTACLPGSSSSSSSSSSSGSSSSSSGGSSSSSTGQKEKGWGSALDGIGSALGVSNPSSWMSDTMMQPLSDTADSGTSALLQMTGTAMEAGSAMSVMSDCADAAKGAVRGGWLGVIGGAAKCGGSAISAAGDMIGGPVGSAISFIGNTVAVAADVLTAPARAVTTLVTTVVGGIASAVSDFFGGWFGRRHLITGLDDCNPLAALFSSGSSSSSSAIGSNGGSDLFSWVLSGDNFAAATSGTSGGFFDALFSDYSSSQQQMGGGGSGISWNSFTSGADYDYSGGDYSSSSSSFGLQSFLSGGGGSSSNTDGDYSFLDYLDYSLFGDYGSSSGDYAADDYSGGLFDSLFGGGDYGFQDYSSSGSSDSAGDYSASGGISDAISDFFGRHHHRRRSALSRDDTAVAGQGDDDEGAAAAAAAAAAAPDGVTVATAAPTSAKAALRACASHLLDLPSTQARACLRLLVGASMASLDGTANDAANAAAGNTNREGEQLVREEEVEQERDPDPEPAGTTSAGGHTSTAGSSEDEPSRTTVTSAASATTQQRETLRVAVWLAQQCYSRDARSAGSSDSSSGDRNGGQQQQADATTMSTTAAAEDAPDQRQHSRELLTTSTTAMSATITTETADGGGGAGGGGGNRGALQRAASLAAADAGHWVATEARHRKGSHTGAGKRQQGSQQQQERAAAATGGAMKGSISSSQTAAGDGGRLCSALRQGLRDLLLPQQQQQQPPQVHSSAVASSLTADLASPGASAAVAATTDTEGAANVAAAAAAGVAVAAQSTAGGGDAGGGGVSVGEAVVAESGANHFDDGGAGDVVADANHSSQQVSGTQDPAFPAMSPQEQQQEQYILPEALRLELAMWLQQVAASSEAVAAAADRSSGSSGSGGVGDEFEVAAEVSAADPTRRVLYTSGSNRESIPVPLRSQRDARRRRRLAAAASGDAAVIRETALQGKLQLYDDAMNEMHRVAQVGFAQQADRNSPMASARRAASMRRILQSSKLPQHKQQSQKQKATTDIADAGASYPQQQLSSLESLLGLDEVQSRVLVHQANKRAMSISSGTGGGADAKLAAAKGNTAAATGGGSSGGLQSVMTERWWGSTSTRIANRLAVKAAVAAAKEASGDEGTGASKDVTAKSSSATSSSARASSSVSYSTGTSTSTGSGSYSTGSGSYSTGSGSYSTGSTSTPSASTPGSTSTPSASTPAAAGGTTASPYLGPDVPPPAISLSAIDHEVSGDGAAGRPQDPLFQLLQPMLGPSFEGMGKDLVGLIRNMWASLDAVSGSQQVQAWLDIALELQNTVAQAPAVCGAGDLGGTLGASQDKPGQWAAATTLRGRGGVGLLQMYRSMIQTHLIRQLRKFALQVEMSSGSPSAALHELSAALTAMSALPSREPVWGVLQKVYDAVKSTELPSLPDSATEAAAGAAATVSATATATKASRFGSNIAVSDRKTATVYFTLTSRSHAHVLRNLSQGLVATVQVPLPRQTKYFDVRMTGVAVRVLADRTSNVTVKHSPSSAAPNHAYVDGLGVDMLRACASALVLPSANSDAAVAAKGPISLYYPDAVAALTGRPVSYNHPVPASYCNTFCPSVGASVSYVSVDGTNRSAGIGSSLFSPYGSWVLQYRPNAGQAGFIKVAAGSSNVTAAPDCVSTPCTFYRPEALQLEFNVSYREILSTEFLGTMSSAFFSSPVGDDSAALAAGLLATSPNTTDPFLPAVKLTNQLTPLGDLCSYRTVNNSMRPLTALNASYTTATPSALQARNSSTGSYSSFLPSFVSQPSSQVSVTVTLELSGLSLQSLQSSSGSYDSDTAKNLIMGIKSYMFQGPASVGKTQLRNVVMKAAASGRRRSMAATTDGDDDFILEPLSQLRGHHWHASASSGAAGASTGGAEAAADAGGGSGDAVTAPARLVYRRRRQLQSSGDSLSLEVLTNALDVIAGNQATGLLNNGDRANSALGQALLAYGIDAKVQVAGVSLAAGDGNTVEPAADPGKKKMSAGVIAGIVIGSVAGVALIAVLIVVIVKVTNKNKVAGSPW